MAFVNWTSEAFQDLDDITVYVGSRNLPAAHRLADLIYGCAEQLADYPYIGREGREPGTRELIAHPNYVIVYAVRDQTVRVLRVLHAAQRYP
jgi:toxin ParE1/3/4